MGSGTTTKVCRFGRSNATRIFSGDISFRPKGFTASIDTTRTQISSPTIVIMNFLNGVLTTIMASISNPVIYIKCGTCKDKVQLRNPFRCLSHCFKTKKGKEMQRFLLKGRCEKCQRKISQFLKIGVLDGLPIQKEFSDEDKKE